MTKIAAPTTTIHPAAHSEFPFVQASGATTTPERIAVLDVLRGCAVLGILVININDFAGPVVSFHDIPYGALTASHATISVVTFYVKWLLFEGKMRGLFSMLFGAGVILMSRRMKEQGRTEMAADIYLRRNMWLVVLGVIHCCLIWHGDILLTYGLSGLLILYPLRHLSARRLLVTGTLLSLVVATLPLIVFLNIYHDVPLQHRAALIEAQERAGQPLTREQRQIETDWQSTVADHRIKAEAIERQISAANQGYWRGVIQRGRDLRDNLFMSQVLPMTDVVPSMMIGMGLMQVGFLTGELSYLTYTLTILAGFAISLPLYAAALAKTVASGLDFITIEEWLVAPYFVTRDAGMIAVAAVLVMLVKSGRLHATQRLLAAVGQTALSNYIMTSLICQTFFIWGPWKLYGRLEYYQLNYVVAALWIINLSISALWLRAFAFGPVEWVWRSLTYLRRQPLRLSSQFQLVQ